MNQSSAVHRRRQQAWFFAARLSLTIGLCGSLQLTAPAAFAQTSDDRTLVMKAGETAQIGNLFWVANCKSLLKGPPVAEVLDGPPGLSVSVVPQKIVPHIANCANPVDGGVLAVSAPAEMNQKTEGRLAIRIVYHTIDGDRQMGRVLAVLVIPADGKEQK